MSSKLIIGYTLGTIAFVYAIYAAFTFGVSKQDSAFNVLLCVAGGLFGWITGILLTPKEDEKKDFSKIGGALFTFVTGFLLAKLEPIFDAELNGQEPSTMLTAVLLFVVCFGVGALFVFVGRKYWQDDI
ncbi:hypothetical protein F0224_16795 [Vibrio coralliilyticus]|uniref:hypothetical protein n=1 Tax=Vibrio coralliilyticus TaxID=190893 RepID=UPI000BAC2191|nr:hypothetical protein [Vibrio coralliilyticus]NOI77346.1 hypothetical protein [Vibrio coralliilyticus]PAW02859.1 hypothetical protein CKJ79_14295 [Vibrio coralliilyticus]